MRTLTGAHGTSAAAELRDVVRLDREGARYLLGRDGGDRQRIWVLEPGDERLWIGRNAACDVVLDWDDQASRAHAELVRVAGEWAVLDDGLSSNGTWVGGERVDGRRRLRDGDVLRVGRTSLVFHAPDDAEGGTDLARETAAAPDLTPMQRKVLIALCRPLAEGTEPRVPASNRAIGEELFLSTEAVKTHVRALCAKFGVGDLPQNQKRAQLAELAHRAGVW